MAKRPYPRIEVSQETFDLLQLEAIRVHEPIRKILDDMVDRHISPEVKRASLTLSQSVEIPKVKEPISQSVKEPMSQKIYLSKNPEAQAKVLKLHKEGLPNTEIGKRLGYGESAIRRFLKKNAKNK
jgi:DNA-binding NarL/FixJ family response regulator